VTCHHIAHIRAAVNTGRAKKKMHLAGCLPMAALLLTASNPHRPAGSIAFTAHGGKARGLAFAIPDVPWYESTAVGWAGTDPDITEGLGHGLWEQVLIFILLSRLQPPCLFGTSMPPPLSSYFLFRMLHDTIVGRFLPPKSS